MTWAYLIAFNEALATRKEMQDFLDSLPGVTYWYACLPNCIFFTSTFSAGAIAKKINEKFAVTKEDEKLFLVVEVHEDRQGWLPEGVWHLFRNPESPRISKKK